MSKDKNPRRVADNEARAKLRMLKTSPQKLNLVAGLIRGKKVVSSVCHRQRREQSQLGRGRADRGGSLCRQEHDVEARASSGAWPFRENSEAVR